MAHSTAHNPASRRKTRKNLNWNFLELNSRVFVFIRVHSRLAFPPCYSVPPCLRGPFWLRLAFVVEFLYFSSPMFISVYQCLSVFISVISGKVLTLSQPFI